MKKDKAREEKNKTQKALSIFVLTLFGIFVLAVSWFAGRPLVRFVSAPEAFRAWVDASGVWGRLAFVGMVVLQIIIAIIPGEPLEIGAGYAFGMLEGTLLCMAGAALGSAAVFLLVRRFGVRLVEVLYSRERIMSLRFLRDRKRMKVLAFLIMLIPGTPKDLLSYFMGLTDIKLSSWLLIATAARIPSIVTSTMGGGALGMKNYQFAALVFAATVVLSGAGFFVYKRIANVRRGDRR